MFMRLGLWNFASSDKIQNFRFQGFPLVKTPADLNFSFHSIWVAELDKTAILPTPLFLSTKSLDSTDFPLRLIKAFSLGYHREIG